MFGVVVRYMARAIVACRMALLLFACCGRIGFGSQAPDPGAGEDAAVARCNSIARVFDDFETTGMDASLWGASYADSGTTHSELNGSLVIGVPANLPGVYAGYKTARHYDLRGARMVGEIVQVGPSGVRNGVHAEFARDTYLGVALSVGQLSAVENVGGAFRDLAMIPYDAAHRYWGISERDDIVTFETSADGTRFTALYSYAPPFDVSLVRMTLFGGADAAVATATQVRYGSAGVPTGSPPPACPPSVLVDTFDDGQIGQAWAASDRDACCTASETGGQARLSTTGAVGFASYKSAAGFDLRDQAVTVKLVAGPTAPDVVAALRIHRDSGSYAELQVTNAMLNARYVSGGTPSNANSFRSGDDGYLRLREAGGVLYYEVSADKLAWRTLRAEPLAYAVDDVLVWLHSGTTVPTAPDTVRFDDYNVP